MGGKQDGGGVDWRESRQQYFTLLPFRDGVKCTLTNTFISPRPHTIRQISDCQIVKYKYKFQNVNLFCNIHPMIMLLTSKV